MENEIEIDLYAQYLYKYLFPRRFGPQLSHQTVQNEDLFTVEVGKAILMTCYEYQEKFHKKFQTDYPIFAEDLCHFMRYAAQIGFALYNDDSDDIFESLFLLTAMILELATFCQLQGHEAFQFYSDICWAEIFKNHYKKDFFENGGWQALTCKSQKKAKLHDTTNHYIYEASDNMGKSTYWLTRFDSNIKKPASEIVSYNSSTSSDSNSINYEIPEEEVFDIIKAATEVGQNLSEGESTTKLFNVTKSSAPAQEVQTDVKPPAEITPLKNLGAIPKTRKIFQNNSKNMEQESDLILLEKFKGLLLDDEDIVAKELHVIVNNDENAKQLINDKQFLRQVEESVTDLNNRPRYQKILENSLRILSQNSTKDSHFVKDSTPKEETALNVPKNVNLGNTGTEQSHNDPIKIENLNNSENKLELSKLIQTTSDTSKNEQSSFSQIVEIFNTVFNLKIDYNFTKEQVENEFSSSNTPRQERKVDEQINEIVEAYKLFNIKDKDEDHQLLHDNYLKRHEYIKAERIKIAKMIVWQSLKRNIVETNNLMQMSKLFTAQRNRPVHNAIVSCLIENHHANQMGKQILKLAASDSIPLLHPDKAQISDISTKPREKEEKLTVSKDLKEQKIALTANCQAKDEFDVEECKNTTIKLILAHRKSNKLLTYLRTFLEKIKLTRTQKTKVEEQNVTANPNQESIVIKEILPNEILATNDSENVKVVEHDVTSKSNQKSIVVKEIPPNEILAANDSESAKVIEHDVTSNSNQKSIVIKEIPPNEILATNDSENVKVVEYGVTSNFNHKSIVIKEIPPNEILATNDSEKISKSPTSSPEQENKQSPKKPIRIYTDSSDTPTSNDSIHTMSFTVSPEMEGEDSIKATNPFQLSTNLARPSAELSSQHEVKFPQLEDLNTAYLEARQESCSTSSGEELFHDASTGWSSDKDEKEQNPVKDVVNIVKTYRKKKKRKKNKRRR